MCEENTSMLETLIVATVTIKSRFSQKKSMERKLKRIG